MIDNTDKNCIIKTIKQCMIELTKKRQSKCVQYQVNVNAENGQVNIFIVKEEI